MARRQKKAEEAGAPGAPEWVVTFTDMVSLLVTFFVLLMTFSSTDTRQLMKVDAWLTRAGTILNEREGAAVYTTIENDRLAARDVLRGALQPHSRPPEELLDNLEEMGRRLTADDVAVDFSQHLDGLVIELDEEAGFAPGSAALTPEIERALTEIGAVLSHYPYLIVVEGTTDAAFRPTVLHDTPEELSGARAAAAAAHLLRTTPVEPTLVQIAALGASAPRAREDDAERRRANRRVRVRVLSLSELHATHLAGIERASGRDDR